MSVGDLDEGIKLLQQAVQLASDYPLNHLLYGEALLADNRRAEAEREFKQVLSAPPGATSGEESGEMYGAMSVDR